MGLIRRLAERLDPDPKARMEPPVEARATDISWQALAENSTDYTGVISNGRVGGAVTPHLAENLTTVSACVNAIGGAISSLPVWVYRVTDKGREVATQHAVMRLIREGPSRYQSWPEFIEWLAASLLLNGNGLAEIVTDGSGYVKSLMPIPWAKVSVVMLPSGRLAYDVTSVDSIRGHSGKTRRLLDSEVLHLKDRSDDGFIGRSRLRRTPGALRTGLTQESFGEILYDNRATPSGILSFDSALNLEQANRVKASVKQSWTGVREAGKLLVLDSGAKYTPITVTPENLEMLATRRFTTEEIARMFGVPPPIVGIWDHSTFTNSETAGRWFAQFTLAPIIRKIEEAIRRSVFTIESRIDHEIEFDMTGFLRGDAEARWKAHEIAVKNQILTPNEIREVEGWNPRDEAEQFSNQTLLRDRL